jgi:hypothetical protein
VDDRPTGAFADRLRYAVAIVVLVLWALSLFSLAVHHTPVLDAVTMAIITFLFGPEIVGRRKR